jgi:hypothetical protein
MKRSLSAVAVVALVALVSACGSARSEVRTSNGGLLDCPSETIEYAVFDRSFDAPGSPLPDGALAILSWDLGEPPGNPHVESETDNEAVFVYTDADGSRVGRVAVVRPETGWFIQWTERCG